MNAMIERHRDRVVWDLALFEDDVKTWNEFVAKGLVKPEHAQPQIQFATDRIASDRYLLNVIDGIPTS
jgi:hypothetical protein